MSTNKAQVLIVDNDEAVVEALSIRFSQEGFDCHTALCGAQASSLIHRYQFDAVLTDLKMPSGDGFALIDTFRKTSSAPVIVITGFEPNFSHDLASYEGIHVVQKPFEVESLIHLVEIVMNVPQTNESGTAF